MTVGFVMMAHTALDRAALVARHLAAHGCPVAIHVDRRTGNNDYQDLVRRVQDIELIHLTPRIACDWGTWSLVAASRNGAEALLARYPNVGHVFLMSGSCLPIKPVPQLIDFLSRHPNTDFIESVTIEDVPWTKGGLSEERFTLSFPFPWKRQRRLFDAWVDVQRRFGRKRSLPAGLKAHMGSQWWCLSRGTLSAILSDPDRAGTDRYFRHVWIPDESYFQSLVRKFGTHIESLSLTISKFDFQGKPHVFYDDHLTLLRQSNAFFARKIWTGATGLYGAFLSQDQPSGHADTPIAATEIDRVFATALKRRTEGRQGLLSSARYPKEGYETSPTAAAYSVFHGFGDVFEGFPEWLSQHLGTRAHGRLFAPDRVEFANGSDGFAGALSGSVALRDYNPTGFLRSLIWNTRGEHQSFLYAPEDNDEICTFLADDPNAYIAAISGAWALRLYWSGEMVESIRGQAARLQKREAAHLERLRERRTRAKVHVWTLADFLARPAEPLQTIVDDFSVPGSQHLTEMPRIREMDGLTQFLQELRNAGMSPHTAGEVPEMHPSHVSPSMRQQGQG